MPAKLSKKTAQEPSQANTDWVHIKQLDVKKAVTHYDVDTVLHRLTTLDVTDLPPDLKSPADCIVIGIDPGGGKSGEAHCVFLVTLTTIYLLGSNDVGVQTPGSVVPYENTLSLFKLIEKCRAIFKHLDIFIAIENNWGHGVPFYQCMTTLIAQKKHTHCKFCLFCRYRS